MSHLTFGTTMDRSHRVVLGADGDTARQATKMAPGYTVVSPDLIAARLEASGLAVEPIDAMGGGWAQSLVVRSPEAVFSGYAGEVSILLNNAGKAAIKLRQGVIRYACSNSFAADDCFISIRHDHADAAEFLADPAKFVRLGMEEAYVVASRVESLRGIGDADALIHMVEAVTPRIAGALALATRKYVEGGRYTFWSALQGLTDTRYSFARGRFDLAQELLAEENLACLLQGQVPELN